MEKVTPHTLSNMKKRGEKIAALTAYDYPMAKMLDAANIDITLVGDSLGMVVHGKSNTLSVTMEEMIMHARTVASATTNAMVVVDMPFMSFQVSPQDALVNAGRIIKETGAYAVKLEGGEIMAKTIRTIVDAGIPVMAHIGLTPQSVNQLGGFKVQGKSAAAATQLLADAKAVQSAGAFAVVLEAIPANLAAAVTSELSIPTIGIGAGINCDGQILVAQDMLGLIENSAKFVRQYAELGNITKNAFATYINDVKEKNFPAEKESYNQPKKNLTAL